MTLYELGDDYLRQNEILKGQIKKRRLSLKDKRGFDLIDEKRNLNCLYEMSRELKCSANVLKNYYNEEPKSKYYHERVNKFYKN